MKKNRKATEQFILKYIKKLTKTDFNVKLYEEMFKRMNDKEFEEFMTKIKNGDLTLQVVIPHELSKKIRVEDNIKLAEELGKKIFQKLIIEDEDGTKFKTPEEYMVIDLMFRRQKQTINKGVGYAENIKNIDIVTGQVRGDSRSTKISFPELQVMVGMGIKDTLIELMRDRGGDLGALRAMVNYLSKYGEVNNRITEAYSTGVMSTKSLKAYLAGMHLKSTL